MLNCKEVAQAITSEELERMSWWQRLMVRFHQWRCPPCQHYQDQIDSVGRMARAMVEDEERLTDTARARIVARCLEGCPGDEEAEGSRPKEPGADQS